jgi:hypothetical protein
MIEIYHFSIFWKILYGDINITVHIISRVAEPKPWQGVAPVGAGATAIPPQIFISSLSRMKMMRLHITGTDLNKSILVTWHIG